MINPVPIADGTCPVNISSTTAGLSLIDVPEYKSEVKAVPAFSVSKTPTETSGYENTFSPKQITAKQNDAAAGTKGEFFAVPNGSIQITTAKTDIKNGIYSGTVTGKSKAVISPVASPDKSPWG